MIGGQVVGHVHQHLVDTIREHIFGGHVFQIDVIDFCAPFDIMGHPGWGNHVIQGQFRVRFHARVMPGGAGELPSWSVPPPLGVHLRHPLYYLEQPCAAGDAIGFQGRCDRQTDGFLCPALVRHHKIGGQGVQAALNALDGSVKTSEIKLNSALSQ